MDISGARFDAHLHGVMAILAGHSPATAVVRHGDGVSVAAVGAGGPSFNIGVVSGRPTEPAAAVAWLRELLAGTGQPFSVHVPGEFVTDLAGPLTAAGLAVEAVLPGMARRTTDDVPPPPSGTRLVRVTDEAELAAHAVAIAVGFGAPAGSRGALDVLVPDLLGDERVTMVNGYLDGADEPCATAVCALAEGVAGIYAVTVHPHARRRGLGAAVTWAAVAAGFAAGAPVAALQATELGEPVYRRMGFEPVREYHRYVAA